jgi:hypothetical protein
VTAEWVESGSTPAATQTQLHQARMRWLMLAGRIGKWLLVWYLCVVCLSFYPVALLWQIESGKIGGAIWLALTFTVVGLVVRDILREINQSRR